MNTILALTSAVFALGTTSCYYGSEYAYTQTSGGYGSGYGHSGISTSFVYTTSDAWIYDPVVRCYYDRRRHAYYDPYLYGYYPRGYTPRPIAYVPHPHGWSGRGRIAPPRSVRSRNLQRHEHRADLLRERNYAWARNRSGGSRDVSRDWQRQRARSAANFDGDQSSREAVRPGRKPATRSSTRNSWGGERQHNTRGGDTAPDRSGVRPDQRQRVVPSGNSRGDRSGSRNSRASRPGYGEPVSSTIQRQQAAQRQAAQRQQAQRQAAQRQSAERSRSQSRATPSRSRARSKPPATRPTHRGGRGSAPIRPQPSRRNR